MRYNGKTYIGSAVFTKDTGTGGTEVLAVSAIILGDDMTEMEQQMREAAEEQAPGYDFRALTINEISDTLLKPHVTAFRKRRRGMTRNHQ